MGAFVESEHHDRRDGDDGRGRGGEWWAAIGFIGLPLLAGAVGADLGASALRGWYPSLTLPPGVPDQGVFFPIWGILYLMVGLAAWLVWRRGRSGVLTRVRAARGLRLWGWQLLLNAAWVPAFFGLRSPLMGMLVLVPLLILIALTAMMFGRVRRQAGWLMLPYLVWTCYATYLNAGVLWLNPPASLARTGTSSTATTSDVGSSVCDFGFRSFRFLDSASSAPSSPPCLAKRKV